MILRAGLFCALALIAAFLVMANRAGAESMADQSAGGPFALPVILRFEGVGVIYGGAAGYRKLPAVGGTGVIGAVSGDVKGFGLGISQIPLVTDKLLLSAGVARISDAHLLSKYSRGAEEGTSYNQRLGAQLAAVVAELLVSEHVRLSFGVINSTVNLKSYMTESGTAISLPGANLEAVKTLSVSAGAQHEVKEDLKTLAPGRKVGLSILTASGRSGQSDSLITNWQLSGSLPVSRQVSMAARARLSDAYVIRRQRRYETDEGVADALHADCESLADISERTNCSRLRSDLQHYIAQSNKNGTAAPLGGNTTLRGYSEGLFRAAHTVVVSIEPRWRVSQTFAIPYFSQEKNGLELSPFYDVGWVADQEGELEKSRRSSYGAGLRLIINDLPIRFDVARGERMVWLLTAGYPW